MSFMNILVIDDEKSIAEAIRDYLEEEGHAVWTAPNGSEGLGCLEHAPSGGYRLILVDLMMPVMDGEQFLEALSERADARAASIIVMTASQRIPTSVLPVQILRKPIELDHLARMVSEISPG